MDEILSLLIFFLILVVAMSGFWSVVEYVKEKTSRWNVVLRFFILTFIGMICPLTFPITFFIGIGNIFTHCSTPSRNVNKTSGEGKVNEHSQSSHSSFSNIHDDIVDRLVFLSLAFIGRKTCHENIYLSAWVEKERERTERPFLNLLVAKNMGEGKKKALLKLLMLFKEMSLFMMFTELLKDNYDLQGRIKSRLKFLLTENLTEHGLKHWEKCQYLFAKNFYETYAKSSDTELSLKYSFWITAREKFQDWLENKDVAELLYDNTIIEIVRYKYRYIERSYKSYLARKK